MRTQQILEFYNNTIRDSHNDYEQNGWSKPTQNSLVNNFIKDYVEKCLKTCAVQIIDIGCGTGMLGDLLESSFDYSRFKYIGVDLNEKFFEINANKDRQIYLRNILEEDFNFQADPGVKTICVFAGIFAIFPKKEINSVLMRGLSWYDTIICYALDSHLCDFIEEDRHNYIDLTLLKYLSTLNHKSITKICFPSIYHSAIVVEK